MCILLKVKVIQNPSEDLKVILYSKVIPRLSKIFGEIFCLLVIILILGILSSCFGKCTKMPNKKPLKWIIYVKPFGRENDPPHMRGFQRDMIELNNNKQMNKLCMEIISK